MKKTLKMIVTALIMLSIIAVTTSVFADDATKYDPSGWQSASTDKIETSGITAWVGSIMNVVAIVGSGIAVIALIILGVKYMMGSVEEKAEYKKTLMPYFIGALFVFGASVLVGFISGILTSTPAA